MKLYFIAGEDSGDLHSSNLIKALRQKLPDLHCRGVGGDKMAQQGAELIAHVQDINFMGFAEVVRNIRIIRNLFADVEADIKAFRPDAVILVDYPGFNLRMAKFVKSLGIKVIYYISPQVWAWKKGRVKSIKAFTDRMMVILPFEKAFYRAEGLEVDFVGHPLLDVIQPSEKNYLEKEGIIALLPGSRKQEISRMLPIMLKLIPHFPRFRFIVGGAPSQQPDFYQALMGDSPAELWINRTYELLAESDYAVVSSGTATLETALFRVPEVVVYKGSWLSYLIGRRLVNIDFISLVNLILGKKAVEELLQRQFTAARTAKELRELMQAQAFAEVQEHYHELWERLGEEGASQRAASVILEELNVGDERK